MSGEILTTIITVLSIFGFMYRQTALLSAEIAAVDKRLSHTDGLVEGLSRALLSTQTPAQTQAQALA